MPRLSHKKARTGCQRCKVRKVKCDEGRPKCRACAKHDVLCEYKLPEAEKQQQQQTLPSSTTTITPELTRGATRRVNGEADGTGADDRDSLLEMRLMHQWTAYTCESFSTAFEFWKYQAPKIAFESRFVRDAIMALAALQMSKQIPTGWNSLRGRMIPTELSDDIQQETRSGEDVHQYWKMPGSSEAEKAGALTKSSCSFYLAGKTSAEMVSISRVYFDRSIEGYREALQDMTTRNAEAIYITSVLTSFNAMFSLSETEADSLLPVNPSLWLGLSGGIRDIIMQWRKLVGDDWFYLSGTFYGQPDLSDENELFKLEHSELFTELLTWAREYEIQSPEDTDAYQKTLSYIGLIYKGISARTEAPLATCRRVIALPSRVPPRFVQLAQRRQPRALVMLAHAFAMMKLLEREVPWFKGIAEKQTPAIFDELPTGWRSQMQWPMSILTRKI